MPSFDVVNEIDHHELSNALDQANRDLQNRFDFQGVDAAFAMADKAIELTAPSDFQVQQMGDILKQKIAKRDIDTKVLDPQDIGVSVHQAKQVVKLKEGIDQPTAKKITKMIKDQKFKVQASIQGEQVRVTGKKRDDLQAVMTFLREAPLDVPLQFNNFRD
jgi:cyclic-di-GMP-binding protein